MVDQVSGFENPEHAYITGSIYASLMLGKSSNGEPQFDEVEAISDEGGAATRYIRVRLGSIQAIVNVEPAEVHVEEDLPDD